jgi:hypothetical protein
MEVKLFIRRVMINSNIIKRFKRDILEFNKGRGMG